MVIPNGTVPFRITLVRTLMYLDHTGEIKALKQIGEKVSVLCYGLWSVELLVKYFAYLYIVL